METSLPVQNPPRLKTVALVGNPNTGKSTLFNALTGFRQRVGNYPGVTVERRSGRLRSGGMRLPVEVIDLPGTYSLGVHQEDEAIVLDSLLGRNAEPTPDAVVCVLDAANLRRNLFLATQILELESPVVVALNMVDLAESAGLRVDAAALSRELGVPVIPVVATKQLGLAELVAAISDTAAHSVVKHCQSFPDCVCAELDGLYSSIGCHTNSNGHRTEAMQTLLAPGGYNERRTIQRCGIGMAEELAERRRRIAQAGESIVEVEARVRYAWIDRVLENVVVQAAPHRSRSEAADRLLTHPVLGLATLLILLGLCFQAIYAWAGPVMDLIDGAFAGLGQMAGNLMPQGALQSLVVDGVIAGVGAVLVFLPQIAMLFLFIAILEDCGFMARAAFLLDRWMALFGLNGKSFIPLLSSYACAVPGIMSTRTIESRSDRFITMLIAPLMSCSARLPVYVLLIAAFIPATPLLGGLVNLQAVTLLAMYCVGAVVAIPIAAILKKTVLKGPTQSFLMELPSYKLPSPRIVFHRVFEQAREFCISAGTIIFAVAIVIWALGYYPRPASVAADHELRRAEAQALYQERLAAIAAEAPVQAGYAEFDQYAPVAGIVADLAAIEAVFASDIAEAELDDGSPEWQAARAEADARLAERIAAADAATGLGTAAEAVYLAQRQHDAALDEIDRDESGAYLRQSFLGRMGQWIEPAVRPLGWDWRIGTAAIASFPAREVVVATIGTIYNLGGDQDENSAGLREKLQAATWPDGRPVFSVAVALSIMVFFALCCQCGATLATIKRETKSWRWPIFTFAYMTALAYCGAFVVYQVASRLSG